MGASRIWLATVSGVLAAACYSPTATIGAPCSTSLECPSGQLCDTTAPNGPTCVTMLVDAPDKNKDAALDDAEVIVDAPIDGPPIDSPPAGAPPANDTPANAIDIAAGGTFMFNLTDAVDDYASACGNGKDVFYKLHLDAPEVIYLDTFGSTANPSIVIHDGDCTPIGASQACVADSCGGTQVQGAWNLAAGDHCVIVDHPGTATGVGQLNVVRGGRGGDPLVGATGSVTGDTCAEDNSNTAGCGCEPAPDHHYFFTVCPSVTVTATISTCTGADWDTVLQIRRSSNMNVACEDDTCSYQTEIAPVISTPGLYWAIMDGCDECGPYTLTYAIQ